MSAIEYRPSIDGLRSLAVVSVLLFHLQHSLLPGGFVGVDIFFVISGYLITSIIVAECENGKFSFARFYQRRVSRIFPAFFLVALAVLVAASVLYTPQDFASAGAVVVAAALSVTNVKFMFQGNYFDVSPDAQPLLHFWSLAVEEQFYIVFPLIVYFAYRLKVTLRSFSKMLIAVAVISFVACVALTATKPTWAFYLLPTRAWELLAGCILATNPNRDRETENPKLDSFLSGCGLLAVVASFFVIHESKSFPGYIATLPVIGTVLLIGFRKNPRRTTDRILSHPLLVFIGKASYSLYLWHWPIYCFIDYSLYTQSFAFRMTLKILLTIVVSLASYSWFEGPMRSYINQPKKQKLSFYVFAVGIVSFVALGFFVRSNNYVDANPSSVKNGGVTFNPTLQEPVVVLLGDSNGSMYGKTLKTLAKKMQMRVHVLSVAAGNPLPDSKLYQDSLLCLERETPDVTILVAAWATKIRDDKAPFETALAQILEHSQHIILITQPPRLPDYATREEIRTLGQRSIFEDATFAKHRQETNDYLISLRSQRVHVVDIESLFVKADGEISFADATGRQLYQDKKHLSAYGSAMVGDLLKIEISKILSAAK